MKSFFCVLVLALFFQSSLQIGTLWVNEIWGNQDTNRVKIEDLVFDDTTMLADFIDGLTKRGVFVEDTQFVHGDVNVPGFMHVFGYATLHGAAFFNGGIFADDGDETTTDVWSFSVDDNTGDTRIKGQLRPYGGINADNCLFTVHNVTGDTRITSALLRPDGGIEAGDELFTVAADDGSFRTRADGIVSLDFLQGSGQLDDKLITRVPAATDFGGNFIIKGQDGVSGGGNLVITPGESDTNGRILFGRKFADDLFIGRSGLDTLGSNGGETTFGGQNAFQGDGGKFILLPGSSSKSDEDDFGPPDDDDSSGFGGEILMHVGLSSGNGLPGKIYLGTDVAGESSFDLVMRRPLSDASSNGGSTTFKGQDSSVSGGDLFLQAGDLTDGYGIPGDLSIIPGVALTDGDQTNGRIYIGNVNSLAKDLHLRRLEVYTSAGDTTFQGQDVKAGDQTPGDLFLQAGNTVGAGLGGNIWIMPGTSEKGTAGSIIWGNTNFPLTVTRNPNYPLNTGALQTLLLGQTSTAGSGGDYNLYGGDGNDAGGTLELLGGSSATTAGGDITFNAGPGKVNGGTIFINGGFGQEGAGGAVIFVAGGSATGARSGAINIEAGLGAGLVRGNVYVGPNANSFYVDNALVAVSPLFISLVAGSNTLRISNTQTNVLQFNNNIILRTPIQYISGSAAVPPPITTPAIDGDQTSTYAVVNQLTTTVRAMVCILGQPSASNLGTTYNTHGLFNIVTTGDINTICDLPSNIA